MKVETPGFKRCCLCVPLRYGILFWGYLRLMIAVFFFVVIILITVRSSQTKKERMSKPMSEAMSEEEKRRIEHMFDQDFIILGVIMGLLLVDTLFSISLIVGGHQKNPRMLSVYLVYNIVMTVLMLIALTISAILDIYLDFEHSGANAAGFFVIIKYELGGGVIFLAIQLYFIFLLRSEIKKLKSNIQFRFVNNATESHCVLEVERGVDGVSGTAGEGDGTGGPGDGTQGDAREGEGGTARRHGEYTRFQ